jgi:hypothetical protein
MTKDFIDDLITVVEVKKTVNKSSDSYKATKTKTFEVFGVEVKANYHLSEEAKRKIGKANKGRITTDETKKKISEALKGRTLTAEARKKISDGHKGHAVTPETRAKLSEAHIGKKLSEETKIKMAKVRKGHAVNEETKRKISEANKGKQRTEEQCKKLSEIRRLPIMTPNGEFISRRFLIQKLTDEGMKGAAGKLSLWFKLYPNNYYYIGKNKSSKQRNFDASPSVNELVEKLLQIITLRFRKSNPLTVLEAIQLKEIASKSKIQNI